MIEAGTVLDARFRLLERLREKRVQQQHLDAVLTQRIGKLVVFLRGEFDTQHVVEQQVLEIPWGQALEAQLWPVQQHLAQRRHLRADVIAGHTGTFLSGAGARRVRQPERADQRRRRCRLKKRRCWAICLM